MNSDLGNIEFDGKTINLNTYSRRGLKDVLTKINEEEIIRKEELDHILKRLV